MTHSRYHLVHSASCSRCEHIAQEVEHISGGVLAAVPQSGAIVQAAAHRLPTAVPVGEPFILAEHGDGDFKIIRGAAMSRLIIRKLGLRRSFQIARLLTPVRFQPSRRGLLRGAVASSVVAVGWAVGVPSLAAADTGDVLTQEDAERRFKNLEADPGIMAALAEIESAGYDLGQVDHCGADLADGTVFVFASFASTADPTNDAALLMTRRHRRGSLESHWGRLGRPQANTSSPPAAPPVVAASLDLDPSFSTGTMLQPLDQAPLDQVPTVQAVDWNRFWNCFKGNTGRDCYTAVQKCLQWAPAPWTPTIGCVIGNCGAMAVQAAWDCKGALTA